VRELSKKRIVAAESEQLCLQEEFSTKPQMPSKAEIAAA